MKKTLKSVVFRLKSVIKCIFYTPSAFFTHLLSQKNPTFVNNS